MPPGSTHINLHDPRALLGEAITTLGSGKSPRPNLRAGHRGYRKERFLFNGWTGDTIPQAGPNSQLLGSTTLAPQRRQNKAWTEQAGL